MRTMLLILLGFIAVQCTCKRTAEPIGPAACPSETFVVTSSLTFKDHGNGSTSSLNLLTSYAEIGMTFNEAISYTLTITGQSSGAEFVLEGTGNSIAFNWYGNSSNGKYFAKGEELYYKVTNLCKTEALGAGQITLATIISYAGFGLKVINYEESALNTPPYGECYIGTCAASMLVTPASAGYVASPQGGNYYRYKATCTKGPGGLNWFFGGQTFTGLSYTSLGNDPTKVYLNFFAKGQANSQALLSINELSYTTPLTRKFQANVSTAGWKLYSVKLSDIGVLDPSKITGVSFGLGASAYRDSSAEVDLDMILFTFDKPF